MQDIFLKYIFLFYLLSKIRLFTIFPSLSNSYPSLNHDRKIHESILPKRKKKLDIYDFPLSIEKQRDEIG